MAKRPRKVGEAREELRLGGGVVVPLLIITEAGRRNTRASITRRAAIIRVPFGLDLKERTKILEQMREWVRETARKQPMAFERFRQQELASRYEFVLRGDRFEIEVRSHDLKTHRLQLVGPGKLRVEVNEEDRRAGTQGARLIAKLLAKFFGQLYRADVERRVRELNDQHFRMPVQEVKLSNTYARWGSCSSVGNINLSTRLLLAPPEVLDAVIIHELAHLVEANHSARFWAEVERALPDYEMYDEWLDTYGHTLSFVPTAVG